MSHAERRQSLTAEEVSIPAGHRWRRMPLIFGVIGLAGIGAGLTAGWNGAIDTTLLGGSAQTGGLSSAYTQFGS